MPPEFAVPSWAVELLDPFASSADGPEGSTVDEDLAFIASLDWMSGGDDGTVLVARAPGRLDVMGGIADYSGALVLQLPLREGCYAALRRTSAETDGDAAIIVTSRAHAGDGRAERVLVPLSALVRRARSCDDAPAKRARTSAACAAAEPIGWVLLRWLDPNRFRTSGMVYSVRDVPLRPDQPMTFVDSSASCFLVDRLRDGPIRVRLPHDLLQAFESASQQDTRRSVRFSNSLGNLA